MQEPKPILIVIFRWTLSFALCYVGINWIKADSQDDLGFMLLGFAGVILAATLVAPELAQWLAWPFTRFIDAFYLTNETEPPPVNFNLAKFYRRHVRYDEALEEYYKMMRFHPRELGAYLGVMEVMLLFKGDKKGANRIRRKALKKFKILPQIIAINETYQSLLAGTWKEPPPVIPSINGFSPIDEPLQETLMPVIEEEVQLRPEEGCTE